MIEVLIILIFFTLVYVAVVLIVWMTDDAYSEKMILSAIVAILLVFVMWIFLRHLTIKQNYRIDKNIVIVHQLELEKGKELKFNKDLKIEITQYNMPNGTSLDYKTYRIYIDSVNYIEYKSDMYDSLDMKYGKKLYKEKK